MRLEILYKQLSGNDSFETPQDRLSVHLDFLEKLYPMSFSNRSGWGTVSTGHLCGAISMFYKGTMEKLSVELGGSFFVACKEDTEAIVIAQRTMPLEKFKGLCDRRFNGIGYFYDISTGKFALV